MPRACETCQKTITWEQGLWCPECLLKKQISDKEIHITWLNKFIAGEYGELDSEEMAEAITELTKAFQDLNSLNETNADDLIKTFIKEIKTLPADEIYSENEKFRLELYRKVIANGIKSTTTRDGKQKNV